MQQYVLLKKGFIKNIIASHLAGRFRTSDKPLKCKVLLKRCLVKNVFTRLGIISVNTQTYTWPLASVK